MKKFLYKTFIVLTALFPMSLKAQDTIIIVNPTPTVEIIETENKKEYPKFKVGGVFQARYLDSYKRGVDVEGLQHSTGTYVRNTYEVKRMRISMNANLTKNLSVVTLVNLADFKSDPKTRVLENAYAQYTVSRYVKYQVGQFRPAFGMEDSYAVDIVKSIDFSNSYYLLGNNGWQSFQIGAAVSGSVDLGTIPFHYAISMTNGNGKNKIDNNNGKHYAGRFYLELNKTKGAQVGFSVGAGEEFGQSIYAYGVEGAYMINFNSKWSLDFQLEAVRGINQYLYFNTPEANRLGSLNNYILQGTYIIPNLRYEIGHQHLQAVDLSIRYEYLNANSKLDSNPRQSWIPMASIEFLKNYGARLQVGFQIDNYKTNIPNTKTYNANLAFMQFQCRLQ